jgi:hypothetical protein
MRISPLLLRLFVLLFVLVATRASVTAQEAEPAEGARVETTEVSGLALDQLSPGLQRDLQAVAGTTLERERLTRLARRIEEEHPDVVAAARIVAQPDGTVRIVFVAARISDDGDLVSNINARYTVERVEIAGVPEAEISAALRDRLQALVGHQLDPAEAEHLASQLEQERPGWDVKRRISRGTQRGRLRVVFEFVESERLRWMPLAPSQSKFVHHSDAGWSGRLDIPMGNRNHRATVGFAFDDNDDLVEEYSGVRLRVESRRVGTERVGASLEVARYNNTWRAETLSALAASPGLADPYRSRVTAEPAVTVALTRQFRLSGGLSLSSLDSLAQSPSTELAAAFVGAATFSQQWRHDRHSKQRAEASYELRASSDGLGSDLAYTRHLGRASYRVDHDHSTFIAGAFVGRITGRAPLFERFTLGDASTLRGWNKFAIAAAGGDHVYHQTIEYRFYGLGVFLDTGAVWDAGASRQIRSSTGFGLQTDHAFITLAFPLNASGAGATVLTGVRF